MTNQCIECGALFDSPLNKYLCPECEKDDQKVFSIIRDYIYDHPGATIQEVSQFTGFPNGTILRYLREGRLETVGSIKVLNCTSCGKAINYGTLCEDCQSSQNRSFSSMGKKKEVKGDVMYTKKKR